MSAYYIGTVLDAACVLMYAGLGDAVLLASGEVNLGGDGQVYASSLAIALTLTAALHPALSSLLAILFGMCIACAIAFICILMRSLKVNILLSTYLTSAAITPIVDYLITQKYRAEGNLAATAFIPNGAASPRILPPSTLSLIALAAPVLCLIAWQYLKKSECGKALYITGISNTFAQYSGLSPSRVVSSALVFCCAMHSIAAFSLVTGTHRTCLAGMQTGLGWSALTVALLARGSAVMVVFYSLLLSIVMTMCKSIALTHLIPFDVNALVSGIAIGGAAISSAIKRRQQEEDAL